MTGPINNDSSGSNSSFPENKLDRTPPAFEIKAANKSESNTNEGNSSNNANFLSPASLNENITSTDQLMKNKAFREAFEQNIFRQINQVSENAIRQMKKNMNSRGNS
jgi:hypothetical protein